MPNFSIENIGAFELNRAPTQGFMCTGIDDGALEESAGTLYAGPTSPDVQCIASVRPFCPHYIDDAALEVAVVTGPNQTIITYCGCSHIDDGALEAIAVSAGSPGPVTARGWTGMCCGRIDDSVN